MKRIPTYVNGLDANIQGGPPAGSTVLIRGAPGTGKTILVLQSLYNAAVAGETVLYFTFDETPQNISWYAEVFNWEIGTLQKEKKFLMFYLSPSEYERFLPERTDTLKERINYIIESTGATRIAFDSMTTISHFIASKKALETELQLRAAVIPVARTLNALAKEHELLMYLTIHPDDPASHIYEFVADGVLDLLFYKDMGGLMQRGLKITKMRATSHPNEVLAVWVEKEGLEIESL